MFEFVRRHIKLMQVALLLLVVPSFVLVGVQGYQKFSDNGATAATIAGRDIAQAEVDAALRTQIERMRAQMPNMDVKMFDTPEMRQRVLDDLVRERVTMEASRKLLLTPTDEQLLQTFQTDPQFERLRNADGTVKKELLAARGISSEQFAAQLKQDLSMRQVFYGIGATVPPTDKVASRALDTMFQQREIQVARFAAKDFAAKVSISDSEMQAYYDDPSHAALFQSREQVSVEYVVLDLEALKKSLLVSDDDLKSFYKENAARYGEPEERRARHILVKLDKAASADEKAKARAKADGLLTELKKNRAAFVDVAKSRSDDPGSAAQGGDLDWFGRGAMTKPFEDAAFALKKGELSEIVTSDFGLHIIEVTDTRGGGTRSFESVRAEIDAEVRKQLAQKRFAEAAEQFTDAVDQDDKLQPIAGKLKLEVRKAEAVTRQPAPGVSGPLAQAKLLEAVFAADVLAGKRNTAAVEVGPSQLAAAHVLAYTAARKLSLAEVKDLVRTQVTQRKSAELARQAGAAQLIAWQKDDTGANLSPAQMVSRAKAGEQSKAVVDAALGAQADKLPNWKGVDLGEEGYAVVKVLKIAGADPSITGDAGKARTQYAQLWAQAESEAYYKALKDRFGVKVNKDATAVKAPLTQ